MKSQPNAPSPSGNRYLNTDTSHWLGLLLCLLLCLVALIPNSHSQQATSIHAGDSTYFNLTNNISWLDDPNQEITIERLGLAGKGFDFIQHQSTQPLQPTQTGQQLWVKIPLNASPSMQQYPWLFTLNTTDVEQVSLYGPAEPGTYREIQLKQTNLSRYRQVTLPWNFERHGEQIFYLKLSSEHPLKFQVSLWRQDHFQERQQTEAIITSLFLGALILLILYCMMLYGSHKDLCHLLLSNYLTWLTLSQFASSGIGINLLPHSLVSWSPRAEAIFYAFSALSIVLLCQQLLTTRTLNRLLNQCLHGMSLAAIGTALVALSAPSILIKGVVQLLLSATCIAISAACLLAWTQSQVSRSFTLGWFAAIAAASIFFALYQQWIDDSLFNQILSFILLTGHILLWTLALTQRLTLLKDQRIHSLKQQQQASSALKHAQAQVVYRALHDPLTGIPNRILLQQRVKMLVRDCKEKDQHLALILVNLVRFSEINATLGHRNGDQILKVISQHLEQLCQQLDHVVRLEIGPDGKPHYLAGVDGVTFAMLMRVHKPDTTRYYAQQFLQYMRRPINYDGMHLDISASVGISLAPTHGNDVDSLIRCAKVAVETAQQRNEPWALYDPELDSFSPRRLSLMGELNRAIETEALELYFQPQINLRNGQVCGAEVLLRWMDPKLGFVSPAEFIPLAERTGMMKPLTYWVLNKALVHTKSLLQQGHVLQVSINLSAQNLHDPNLVPYLSGLARAIEIPYECIALEVTETAVVKDPQQAMQILNTLHDLGVSISVDDYGTGYSSLAYLKQLPVDELKIDRSFIMDLQNCREDQIILRATIEMAHQLGIKVVAEGVEEVSQQAILESLNCDIAQGYHFAKPMPAKDFDQWLVNYQPSQSHG